MNYHCEYDTGLIVDHSCKKKKKKKNSIPAVQRLTETTMVEWGKSQNGHESL